MLAASARPLAEALIEALRSGRSYSRLRATLPDEEEYGPDQFSLQLDDDDGEKHANESIRFLHPDEAAAAVLLGQAFEHSRDALARLKDPDSVVVIEVPHTDLVEPVASLLHKHLLGHETPVIDGDGLDEQTTPAPAGTVIIFERTEQPSSRKALAGATGFAAAAQLRCALIGITADTSQLPRELVSLAEHRILVPPLGRAAIAAVIEAVTGKHSAIDEDLARRVTLKMLSIAVRADLGAERSVARLRRLIGTQPPTEIGPLLSEMQGLGAAQKFGLELVADLRAHIAGTLSWSACPRGLLLSGPPGTGKTSYARALSAEVGGHFIPTSYAEWQSYRDGNLGNVTACIRKIFSEAKKIFSETNKPVLIFIDEISSLPARGRGDDHSNLWFTAIVNTLLEQLDGYEKREGVVVIAACNDPSRLDPALIRAGRLDHHIAIPLPDVPALIGIFRTHLGADLAAADLRAVALAARGHTGADVERWVRVARRTARSNGRTLTLHDLLDAVRGDRPEWPADVRRRVAYHEAGHAIALLAFGIAEPTALSIGGAGGLAESDLGEMRADTHAHLENFLVALLGGRAAEQIAFAEVTAGAGAGGEGSDLSRATRLAMRLETEFGFGSIGLISFDGGLSSRDLMMFDRLRAAVGLTLDRAYATALEVLARNRSALDALAAALYSAGYLDRAEIEAVLAQTPLHSQAPTDLTAPQHLLQCDAAQGETATAAADKLPLVSSDVTIP
jgi:DNA polymerase III delta prime subunit